MNFTAEELVTIRNGLTSLRERQLAAFSWSDPAIDALVEKIDTPVEVDPQPEAAPAKKSKK